MFNFGFGGMGGMGGMGGGMPHGHGGMGRESRRREVSNTRFYEILEIERTATEVEIKKAFRKQAMQHHPDKNPDNRDAAEAKFKEISKAYEVLSDSQKRSIYDDGGEEALEGGSGGDGPVDIFDLFGGGMFGGERGGRGGASRGPKKGENVNFPLKVTLEDLYNGTSKKLRLTKSVICQPCKGKGGKSGADATCRGCKGHGVRLVVRQLGPGMIQQLQQKCGDCNGTGSSMAEKDKCKACKGEKTVKEKKTLEVFIEKGMKHGEKLPFQGEADESPDTIPGDVVVILQLVEHDTFKREGNHLAYKKSITLVEALTGFSFYLEHLDGRILLIKSEPGIIYKPNDIKCIKNEGMPSHKNHFQKGNLFIEFTIKFPENHTINDNSRELIISALGAPAKPIQPTPSSTRQQYNVDMNTGPDENGELPSTSEMNLEPEEFILEDVDRSSERSREEENARQAYDEDDEDEDQNPRQAGCRTQ